ncbi:leucine-rich repeat domain-containing protein [Fusibacter ferrireducens]|uniref:Leucine-rich repeat domain-containing protein n=1 Tax=Fusibacter ferrireducens TaxID=2785058 RepID=A0ABR9ZXJ1_9FIRM|nr:leucine-rich repeat domain-containing protein [Fusibacter ferrireducens]MBF4695180.1 leucine-rich repeat domain-containing protein [Fusibacter ferrireducens]
MRLNFNTLLKLLIELRYESNKKNVCVVSKYEEQRERFQKEIKIGVTPVLDLIIETFDLRRGDLITFGNNFYLESISSSNLSQWQKNIMPTPVKAAFVSHAVADALKDIAVQEMLEMTNKLKRTLNLKKMQLDEPKSEAECYLFFFKLLALAYKNELIYLTAEEIEKKHLEAEAHTKLTDGVDSDEPVKSLVGLSAFLNLRHLKWMVAFFVILVIASIGVNMTLNPYVDFNDPTLEAVLKREVEGAIGKKIEGKITKEEALSISKITYDLKNPSTTQWYNHVSIHDLYGIQYFKNLELINFRGNQISELGALKHLKKLNQLYLGSNGFDSIEALSGLTELKRLAIDGNLLTGSLEPLKTLKNLELLNISYTNVKDITPILELKALKYLYFQGPTNADVSIIRKMSQLEDVYLDHTNLKGGYDFLGQMTNLRHLNLSQNNLSEIKFVASLPLLEGLDVKENQITDISPILEAEARKEVDASRMKFLKLDHNQIQDIKGLSALKELKRLTLASNWITSYNEAYIISARNPLLEKDFEIDLEDYGSIIQNPHDEIWYKFIPSQTDLYVCFSISEGLIQGAVFDEDREKILSGWYNEGEVIRFYTEGVLEAGKTYFIKIRARGEQLTPYKFHIVGEHTTVSKDQISIVGVENHFVPK